MNTFVKFFLLHLYQATKSPMSCQYLRFVHNQQKYYKGANTVIPILLKVNPDQILTLETQQQFQRALQAHDSLFDPHFSGYNGKVGAFNMKINMRPTQPPQRKGRLPQYSKEKLHILQDKCNE